MRCFCLILSRVFGPQTYINLHWVEWAIITHPIFGPPIMIVEIPNYYNLHLATVKLFENSHCLKCLLFCNHPLSSFVIQTKIVYTPITDNYHPHSIITTNYTNQLSTPNNSLNFGIFHFSFFEIDFLASRLLKLA